MPSQTPEQPILAIKWRETSYGLHVGKASGIAFQLRQSEDGRWQPRMKVWAPNARFENLGQPLDNIEDAKSECEAAYWDEAGRMQQAPAAAMPAPAPKPRQEMTRPVTSKAVAAAVAERSAPKKAVPAPVAAPVAEAREEEISRREPVAERSKPVAEAGVDPRDALIEKLAAERDLALAERDEAISAYHAALCRPQGLVPPGYEDLFDSAHPVVVEFKAQERRDREAANAKKKNYAAVPG